MITYGCCGLPQMLTPMAPIIVDTTFVVIVAVIIIIRVVYC